MRSRQIDALARSPRRTSAPPSNPATGHGPEIEPPRGGRLLSFGQGDRFFFVVAALVVPDVSYGFRLKGPAGIPAGWV